MCMMHMFFLSQAIIKLLYSEVFKANNDYNADNIMCVSNFYSTCLAQIYWNTKWERSKLYHSSRRISLLLIFILSFALNLCNNKDILLLP